MCLARHHNSSAIDVLKSMNDAFNSSVYLKSVAVASNKKISNKDKLQRDFQYSI